jgi:hypothetical protein
MGAGMGDEPVARYGRKMRTSVSNCSNAQVAWCPPTRQETRQQQMHASHLGPHARAAAKLTPRLCAGMTLCGVTRQALLAY